MQPANYVVIVRIDDQLIALPLVVVERVVRAVEVLHLPDAPPGVLGLVNVHGRVIPVLSLRGSGADRRVREVTPADQFVIAGASGRMIGIWIDGAEVVEGPPESRVALEPLSTGRRLFREVFKLPGSIVPILDVDALLTDGERQTLDESIVATVGTGTARGGRL